MPVFARPAERSMLVIGSLDRTMSSLGESTMWVEKIGKTENRGKLRKGRDN